MQEAMKLHRQQASKPSWLSSREHVMPCQRQAVWERKNAAEAAAVQVKATPYPITLCWGGQLYTWEGFMFAPHGVQPMHPLSWFLCPLICDALAQLCTGAARWNAVYPVEVAP